MPKRWWSRCFGGPGRSRKNYALLFFPLGFDPLNSSLLARGGNVQGGSDQTYTGSLDLTGKFDTFGLHHILLLGGDFLRADNSFLGDFTLTGVPSIDIFNPVHTGVPAGLLDNPDFRFSFDSVEDWYGFYLQDQLEMPYHLHLLAGFRYDNAGTSTTFASIIPGPPTPSETSGGRGHSALRPLVAAFARAELLRQLCRELRNFERAQRPLQRAPRRAA